MAIAGVEVAAPEYWFISSMPSDAKTPPAGLRTEAATSTSTGAITGEPIPSTTQMAANKPWAKTMGAGTSLAFAAASERGAETNETP